MGSDNADIVADLAQLSEQFIAAERDQRRDGLFEILAETQLHRWRTAAAVDEEDFNEWLSNTHNNGEESNYTLWTSCSIQ